MSRSRDNLDLSPHPTMASMSGCGCPACSAARMVAPYPMGFNAEDVIDTLSRVSAYFALEILSHYKERGKNVDPAGEIYMRMCEEIARRSDRFQITKSRTGS